MLRFIYQNNHFDITGNNHHMARFTGITDTRTAVAGVQCALLKYFWNSNPWRFGQYIAWSGVVWDEPPFCLLATFVTGETFWFPFRELARIATVDFLQSTFYMI
jgi:hypothetical protein